MTTFQQADISSLGGAVEGLKRPVAVPVKQPANQAGAKLFTQRHDALLTP